MSEKAPVPPGKSRPTWQKTAFQGQQLEPASVDNARVTKKPEILSKPRITKVMGVYDLWFKS